MLPNSEGAHVQRPTSSDVCYVDRRKCRAKVFMLAFQIYSKMAIFLFWVSVFSIAVLRWNIYHRFFLPVFAVPTLDNEIGWASDSRRDPRGRLYSQVIELFVGPLSIPVAKYEKVRNGWVGLGAAWLLLEGQGWMIFQTGHVVLESMSWDSFA